MARGTLGPLLRLRLAAGELVAQPLRTVVAVVMLAPLVSSWYLLAGLSNALADRPGVVAPGTLLLTGPDLFDPETDAMGPADVTRAVQVAGADAVSVTPMVGRLVEVEDHTLQLRAAPTEVWASAHDLELLEGRAPLAGADEVALTASVSGATGWDLGDVISVFGSDLTVTGVYRAAGSKVAAIWMELQRAEQLFERPDDFQFVAVELAAGADATDVRDRLQAAFPELLVLDETRVQLEASSNRRSLGELARVFTTLGFVGLAAGSATATALSLAERRRAVGVLRMLGFPPAHVRGLVGARALLVTVGSLVVGLAVAVPLVRTQPALLIHSHQVDMTVGPVQLVAGSLGSLAGAWLGAVLAARRAVASPVRSLLER